MRTKYSVVSYGSTYILKRVRNRLGIKFTQYWCTQGYWCSKGNGRIPLCWYTIESAYKGLKSVTS